MTDKVVYHTGHEKSLHVCIKIAAKTGFPLEHVKDYKIGTTPIVYGLFRGTDAPIRKARWSGLNCYYVDHGYMQATKTNYYVNGANNDYSGYYRVVKNGMFADYGQDTNDSNLNQLHLCMKPMYDASANTRHHAIICAPSLEGSMFLPEHKVWPEEWIEGVKHQLESFGYIVEVSTKHEGNKLTDKDMSKYALAVSHDSATIVYTLLHGVPSDNLSLYNQYGISTEKERYKYLSHLANNQYKLDDINVECFK